MDRVTDNSPVSSMKDVSAMVTLCLYYICSIDGFWIISFRVVLGLFFFILLNFTLNHHTFFVLFFFSDSLDRTDFSIDFKWRSEYWSSDFLVVCLHVEFPKPKSWLGLKPSMCHGHGGSSLGASEAAPVALRHIQGCLSARCMTGCSIYDILS